MYRLDPDGSVHRVVTDCGKCNGVLVSPDQKTLYVIGNDNGWFEFQNLQEGEKTLQGAHQLQAYDLSPDGKASNRRVLIDYTKQEKPCSGPDGMVADTEGNIWLASRCEWRPGIQVLSPTGKETRVHLHRQGVAHECGLRPWRGLQSAVSDLGQESVQDPGRQEGISTALTERLKHAEGGTEALAVPPSACYGRIMSIRSIDL